MFYLITRHAHSALRWIVLALLVISILVFLKKWLSKSQYTKKDNLLALFTVEGIHIQFLLGLILYFISPKVVFQVESMKNTLMRFYLLEHSLLMILAVGLISIGYSLSKKTSQSDKKFKKLFIFFLITLVLILLAIPWPWRPLGAGWI